MASSAGDATRRATRGRGRGSAAHGGDRRSTSGRVRRCSNQSPESRIRLYSFSIVDQNIEVAQHSERRVGVALRDFRTFDDHEWLVGRGSKQLGKSLCLHRADGSDRAIEVKLPV